eukprot:554909-Pyramimonas_sp.AAC.1
MCYDQVDASKFASMELMCRQIQLLAWHHGLGAPGARRELVLHGLAEHSRYHSAPRPLEVDRRAGVRRER